MKKKEWANRRAAAGAYQAAAVALEDKPAWPKRPGMAWEATHRLFVWYGAPWHKTHPKDAGFRWNAQLGCWYTPDFDKAASVLAHCDPSPEVVDLLANLAGTQRGDSLAATAARIQNAVLADSRATDADVDLPRPDGLEYLGFQKAGIVYAVKRYHGKDAPKTEGVLIADEPGLGKTIQAAGFINAVDDVETVLVVCPATLKINWQRELNKWLVRRRSVMIAEPGYFPRGGFIVIVNYDLLRKHHNAIYAREWDLVVADEAHLAKSEKAIRSKELYGIPARFRLFLTGTPIVNRPMEVWPLLKHTAPATFASVQEFERKYRYASPSSPRGRRQLAELQNLMRATCMVRRLKRDVLKDLPPKTRQIIEIPADRVGEEVRQEQAELMKFLDNVHERQLAVELAKGEEQSRSYDLAMIELREAVKEWMESVSVLRHLTAKAKIPSVVDHVRELVDTGAKVILFAYHRDVIDAYMAAFKGLAVKVDGSMQMRDRQVSVDRFQKDASTKVFIGQINAAGVGLTLTASSNVVFAELDWVPGMMTQAEDRAHRHGQTENVLVQHIVLIDSLDAHMARTLVQKQKVIEAATDAQNEREQLGKDPIVPNGEDHASAGISWLRIGDEAAKLTAEQRDEALDGLRWLAQHGQDMNRLDVEMAKAIADVARPNARQAALARRIVRRYREQMPL